METPAGSYIDCRRPLQRQIVEVHGRLSTTSQVRLQSKIYACRQLITAGADCQEVDQMVMIRVESIFQCEQR